MTKVQVVPMQPLEIDKNLTAYGVKVKGQLKAAKRVADETVNNGKTLTEFSNQAAKAGNAADLEKVRSLIGGAGTEDLQVHRDKKGTITGVQNSLKDSIEPFAVKNGIIDVTAKAATKKGKKRLVGIEKPNAIAILSGANAAQLIFEAKNIGKLKKAAIAELRKSILGLEAAIKASDHPSDQKALIEAVAIIEAAATIAKVADDKKIIASLGKIKTLIASELKLEKEYKAELDSILGSEKATPSSLQQPVNPRDAAEIPMGSKT